jgi:eukaryotic-like serine/threonine-protein kinase
VLASELPPRYELLGELATGGMATVYLARQPRSNGTFRLVAVKSIRPELAQDEEFLAMFLDEATLTSRIKHRNVVQTLDLVSADGRLLIVMEYVEGVSLSKLLEVAWQKRTSIPASIALAILCDVLRGLHAAHELVDEQGRPLAVVHRDVSPQNVIVGTDGVARILDFGIAKAASQQHVTLRGEIKGKLAYMPIEQQLGELVDRRSDVYAAGVVLWELLTGRRLFSEPNEEELVRQVFEGRIDPPSLWADTQLPSEIDHVVLRALARKREDRWWSAEEMAKALNASPAMRPATQGDVAMLVHKLGSDELDQRSHHLRDLQSAHTKLAPEEQIVLEVLTGERARGHPLIPQQSSPPPPAAPVPPPAPQRPPQHRTSAPPPAGPTPSYPLGLGPAPTATPSPPSAPSDRRARRREQRRRRRLFLFGGLALAIVFAMGLAFLLGMGTGLRPG